VAKDLVPIDTPIAVFSDVHGNLTALEAVLAELDKRRVPRALVLGDHLLGGAQPLETWRRLSRKEGLRLELGRSLGDTALATLPESRLTPRVPEDEPKRAQFLETRKAVGALVLKALEKLPTFLRAELADGRELLALHGAPRDPGAEITHDLDDDELSALLGDEPADIVVVAGAHVPFQRELGPTRIVGLGAVGEPLGPDRAAHVVLVTPRYDGAVIEDVFVPYGQG
jgi:predicted phosphodiesterase